MYTHQIEVMAVRHLGDYRLRLFFSDGKVKDVDLANELWGSAFEALQDLALFSQVKVDPDLGTIAWVNGADFAPDALYEMGQEIRAAA